jgi:predicted metal-dependent hydrolase
MNREITAILESCRGRELDARYLAFFECFNRQLFFEAHEVLEELWLAQRHGPNHAFHKGLIQLAGAFVHLQKGRLGPAASLLKLAEANLNQYPPFHDGLDVRAVIGKVRDWLRGIEHSPIQNPLVAATAPRLSLQAGSA